MDKHNAVKLSEYLKDKIQKHYFKGILDVLDLKLSQSQMDSIQGGYILEFLL